MRPDATSPIPSPFLAIPEAEWLCANDFCFAIFDRFPVSPGHVLVITRRVVPTYFDCTAAEQAALMELVGEVKRLLDERLEPKPDGYNVGFNAGTAAGQTVPHVHVHVIPRYSGDMPDPRGGVRHVIPEKGNYLAGLGHPHPNPLPEGEGVLVGEQTRRAGASSPLPLGEAGRRPGEGASAALSLTTGPDRPLWPRLADRLPGASEIDLLASFVQTSGLDHVREGLFNAIAAGARIRLLVGDYLGITSPEALRQLVGWMDLAGPVFEARLVELNRLRGSPASFHPKAWRIADSSGGIVVVGSSNLSRAALVSGVEWNLVGETSGDAPIDRELVAAFDELWQQATPLDADVVARYAARAEQAAELRRVWEQGHPHPSPLPEGDGVSGTPLSTGRAGFPSPLPLGEAGRRPGEGAFAPRPWQQEALASLAAIRRDGYTKALVAVATGLGKTWLAAFDVVAVGRSLGRLPRVLVIAHRAEILAQAEATLRTALAAAAVDAGWPAPVVTWFAGSSANLSGTLVIASIQKLSRPDGLTALEAAEPFDYCVVDEVHHAEAPSYRRVLARLKSSFTLGLTATPERTDGVDVATLFDDILAAQATIGDGIAEGSLVPFRYRGLKDDVDFERIPWRNGRFDVGELEAALESAPRMERLWEEWQKGDSHLFHAGQHDVDQGDEKGDCHLFARPRRTLVFCCSRRHAVFARDWLRKRGVAAAAVFSDAVGAGGPVSDPRMASLAAFVEGRLDALCVVDLFNEGVDIPLVDRVVMLRPTESKIVFLQQIGRGLRSADGKSRLEVIDFVGNHRVFASRLMHLFALAPPAGAGGAEGDGAASSWSVLQAFLAGAEPVLPPGCVVDVELEAKDLLSRLVGTAGDVAVAGYRVLRTDLGRRPTPTEVLHAGYKPLVASARHDHWFDFCSSEGDLAADEQAAATRFSGWFTMLQRTQLTKSYKVVVLRVLLDRDAVWDGMGIDDLAAACRRFLESHPALRADLAGTPDTPSAFAAYWLKWPLSRWMDEQSGRRWFTRTGDRFGAAFTCPPELRAAFESLTGELVDYRLAHYSQSRLRPHAGRDSGDGTAPAASFRAKVSHSGGKPILFVPPVEDEPARPTGPTRVRLPDGSEWVFKFVKVACNVAHKSDAAAGARATAKNDLPALLRDWFGPDAGLPGTGFEVEFTSDGTTWHAAPVSTKSPGRKPGDSGSEPTPTPPRDSSTAPPLPLLPAPPPAARHTTHVPVYDLTAAAGFWGPESVPEEIGWTEVPGVTIKPGMFVARVTGTSMEPLIPDGSWCLFRPCPAGSREGRIVLVQFASLGAGENGGRFTVKKYHSEKTVTADGWRHDRIQLLPVNPAFEPITLEPEDANALTIIAEFVAVAS